MSDDSDDRVRERADHLLPEESTVGSDDPRAQAEAILDDSDQREHGPDIAPDTYLERRTSDQTVVASEPPD